MSQNNNPSNDLISESNNSEVSHISNENSQHNISVNSGSELNNKLTKYKSKRSEGN